MNLNEIHDIVDTERQFRKAIGTLDSFVRMIKHVIDPTDQSKPGTTPSKLMLMTLWNHGKKWDITAFFTAEQKWFWNQYVLTHPEQAEEWSERFEALMKPVSILAGKEIKRKEQAGEF